jgi:flagellar motor switch protein FliM
VVDNLDNLDNDALDDLDLDAAIGAAENLAGAVNDGMGVDLEDVLNADSSEDELGSGPRRYDFNRPTSISRTFEQNLQSVAESFAKTGTIDFTSLMRMTTTVEFLGLKQTTFAEYLEELPNPTCGAMVTLSPLKGYSMLHIDLGLCFVFLKKLMGGTPDMEDSVREFTEIERGINAGLVNRFAEIFRKAAAKFIQVEPRFTNLENNPNYLSGINEGEAMIILKFRVKVDTVEGPVELGLPLPAFSPVRDIFDPVMDIELRTTNELREDRRKVMDLIQGTGTELTAELGGFDSNLEEILNLKVGDILHLPQGVDTPLNVKIEGESAWLGEAGRIGQNRAIKLIRQLTKE